MKRTTVLKGTAMLGLLALAATAQAQRSDEGVRRVERLTRASRDVVQAIGDTREQLVRTMAVYNSLMADNAENRRRLFTNLQREMERSDERRARITQRVVAMDAEANTLFGQWSTSAAAIGTESLRARSEERLAAARARHSEIHAAGQQAGDLYATFMKTLRDQVTFLGHDLNPGAVAALKPDAAKLNTSSNELLASIDAIVATANRSISALQPQ